MGKPSVAPPGGRRPVARDPSKDVPPALAVLRTFEQNFLPERPVSAMVLEPPDPTKPGGRRRSDGQGDRDPHVDEGVFVMMECPTGSGEILVAALPSVVPTKRIPDDEEDLASLPYAQPELQALRAMAKLAGNSSRVPRTSDGVVRLHAKAGELAAKQLGLRSAGRAAGLGKLAAALSRARLKRLFLAKRRLAIAVESARSRKLRRGEELPAIAVAENFASEALRDRPDLAAAPLPEALQKDQFLLELKMRRAKRAAAATAGPTAAAAGPAAAAAPVNRCANTRSSQFAAQQFAAKRAAAAAAVAATPVPVDDPVADALRAGHSNGFEVALALADARAGRRRPDSDDEEAGGDGRGGSGSDYDGDARDEFAPQGAAAALLGGLARSSGAVMIGRGRCRAVPADVVDGTRMFSSVFEAAAAEAVADEEAEGRAAKRSRAAELLEQVFSGTADDHGGGARAGAGGARPSSSIFDHLHDEEERRLADDDAEFNQILENEADRAGQVLGFAFENAGFDEQFDDDSDGGGEDHVELD